MAPHTDPNLLDAWGMAELPDGGFIVADALSGFVTFYSSNGKTQRPPITDPAAPLEAPTVQVLFEVGEKIRAMDAVISRAEERFGKRTRLLNHRILGPLLGRQWRKFHWVHGGHHVKQMRILRATFSA